MARAINKLTAGEVEKLVAAKKPGLYGDGAGLALRISSGGSASWVLRYSLRGKSHEAGVGPIYTVGLGDARKRAKALRAKVLDGIDPVQERKDARKPASDVVTFKIAAERFMAKHGTGWRSAKHAADWASTLETYVYPVIGKLDVAALTVSDIERALAPIWVSKAVTADRVRSRIQLVLDFATASEWRSGDNPAARTGPLGQRLPNRVKAEPKHHAALPYRDMPQFMSALRRRRGVAARAVEFAILTAARSGEVRGARWSEVNLAEKVWRVPASRMKGNREHIVPLSEAAVALLDRVEHGPGDLVFHIDGRELSEAGVGKITKLAAGTAGVTLHGFRSSFRDWCGDETTASRETAEAALAHVVGDKAEQAYRRGAALMKRRALMQQWADWCDGKAPADNVVALRRA
jgi:integrase